LWGGAREAEAFGEKGTTGVLQQCCAQLPRQHLGLERLHFNGFICGVESLYVTVHLA
jgi:hypothetical protein